jgi:hypothetical protein
MMEHASPKILADLDKLNPDHAAQIREVAGRNTTSTVLGANRPAPVRDWVRKIARPATDPLPAREMPASSGKPKADWPAPTHGPFASGLAKKASLGTMPSRTGPSK